MLVTDCTIEPDNKHSDNAIVVKSGNDNIVGHVSETLAKKLFNFMKSQQIGFRWLSVDSELLATLGLPQKGNGPLAVV